MIRVENGSKAFDTKRAAESYSKASLSIGYIASIEGIVKKGIKPFLEIFSKDKAEPATIFEVGGGQGKSAGAIDLLLRSLGYFNLKFIGTEYEIKQIKEGRKFYNLIFLKIKKHKEFIPPEIQSDAEALPIPNESVDIHMSSQVDHWIIPVKKLLQSYKEALRVLKTKGLFVHAVSGLVDLGENNKYHFTRSPFYLEAYLPEVKKILIKRGLWNENQGEFVPWNPNVNPFYHNYSLDVNKENGLPLLLKEAGFEDVKVNFYMACLNANEIEMRMTELSMINMHLFRGSFAEEIDVATNRKIFKIKEKDRVRIAKQAFEEAKKNRPDLWNQLSSQKNEIIEGIPQNQVYGEPVPVITARKK